MTITYGVVVLSILAQGLTMTPLMKWLALVGKAAHHESYATARGELRAVKSALSALETLEREGGVHHDIASRLRGVYEHRRTRANDIIRQLHLEADDLRQEEELAARRLLLKAEKQAILTDASRGAISHEAAEHLQREIDARLVRLEDGDFDDDLSEARDAAPAATPPERPADP
jgi:CPA1 family monovalent cation:H+ antiporter